MSALLYSAQWKPHQHRRCLRSEVEGSSPGNKTFSVKYGESNLEPQVCSPAPPKQNSGHSKCSRSLVKLKSTAHVCVCPLTSLLFKVHRSEWGRSLPPDLVVSLRDGALFKLALLDHKRASCLVDLLHGD